MLLHFHGTMNARNSNGLWTNEHRAYLSPRSYNDVKKRLSRPPSKKIQVIYHVCRWNRRRKVYFVLALGVMIFLVTRINLRCDRVSELGTRFDPLGDILTIQITLTQTFTRSSTSVSESPPARSFLLKRYLINCINEFSRIFSFKRAAYLR